jgi:CheY-like chemotaxis protein
MPVPRPLYPTDTRVLIVEDSRDDATIMAGALQTFGAGRPSLVAGGEETLAFRAGQPSEIVFIDYRLPGMDGLQLRGRTHELWPEPLTIIVTGVRDDRVAVAACPQWSTKMKRLDGFAGPDRCPRFYPMIDDRWLQVRPRAPTYNMRVRPGGPRPCPRRPHDLVRGGLKGSTT